MYDRSHVAPPALSRRRFRIIVFIFSRHYKTVFGRPIFLAFYLLVELLPYLSKEKRFKGGRGGQQGGGAIAFPRADCEAPPAFDIEGRTPVLPSPVLGNPTGRSFPAEGASSPLEDHHLREAYRRNRVGRPRFLQKGPPILDTIRPQRQRGEVWRRIVARLFPGKANAPSGIANRRKSLQKGPLSTPATNSARTA